MNRYAIEIRHHEYPHEFIDVIELFAHDYDEARQEAWHTIDNDPYLAEGVPHAISQIRL